MNRTSNILNDELLDGELPLAEVLKRFAEREKQRRARYIVQRRAKQLNEVREAVLRRRAEKGQPMDTIEEKAQEAGLKGRDKWENKKDDSMVAAIALGLGNDNGNDTPNTANSKDNDEEGTKTATSVVKKLRSKTNKRHLRARRENNLRQRGQGITTIPRDFSPLADIPEKDLGRVYAEDDYSTRFKLYHEAVRKACGLKVWTWEELTDGSVRTLRETCRIPSSHCRKQVNSRVSNTQLQQPSEASTGNVAATNAVNPKSAKSSVAAPCRNTFKVPDVISRDVVRSIRQEIQDDKREQELKFLELEMKMTPYVVDAGLFDSDPEFTTELNESIAVAHAKQKLFETMQNEKKRGRPKVRREGAAGSEKTKASWIHIPTATAKRAEARKAAVARRQERKAALDYDPYEDDLIFKGTDSMLCYDPNTGKFLPPQATLLRAREREQEALDRARWRQRRRAWRQVRRLAKARTNEESVNIPRPPERRSTRPPRDTGARGESQSPSSGATLEEMNLVGYSSNDNFSCESVPIQETIKSSASPSRASFRNPGYYLGDNLSSSSSTNSLSSSRFGEGSSSVASTNRYYPGVQTPINSNASDAESQPRATDRRENLSAVVNVVAGNTGPEEESNTIQVSRPNQWCGYEILSSSDDDYNEMAGSSRSVSRRSSDSWSTVRLIPVRPKKSRDSSTPNPDTSTKTICSTPNMLLSQVSYLSPVRLK